MDFSLDPEVEVLRADLRRFFTEHLTPERRGGRLVSYEGRDLWTELAASGHLAKAVPAKLGGTARSPWETVVLHQEFDRALVMGPSRAVLPLHSVLAAGTDEQMRHYTELLLAGRFIGSIGYSERESGSDIAAARTRAVRDGDGWTIDGEKIFTGGAMTATHVLLLTRTNADVAKHKGLTMFLVPLDTPGIRVEPLETLGTPSTLTHYDKVRVADDARIGDVDAGWSVVLAALAHEHSDVTNLLTGLLEEMVRWALEPGPDGARPAEDPNVRERIARTAVDEEVCSLLAQRNAWLAEKDMPGPEGSSFRLFRGAAYVRASDAFMDMVGPEALLTAAESGVEGPGYVNFSFRDAPVWTTQGGSSEIHREIIATRRLGLPKNR